MLAGFSILLAVVSAIYDVGMRFENHVPRFLLRAFVAIYLCYYFSSNWIEMAQSCYLFASVFYGTFDYLLNILEGRKWNYIGETAEIDKLWREVFYTNPQAMQFIFKIFLIFSSLIIFQYEI